MKFDDPNLQKALSEGLSSGENAVISQAKNITLEQCVADVRRRFFETERFGAFGDSWDMLTRRQSDYVRLYVKTGVDQPHTFQDDMKPNGVGDIDSAQMIVRLESLARPLLNYGCSINDLKDARDMNDTDFLDDFCEIWNEDRDYRPAFATLLGEVAEDIEADDWADLLRDRLGLAHLNPTAVPEPVALMKYSVSKVVSEATTGYPITMPTVLDSDPWEYYFPAPKTMKFGRAMALRPCEDDENLVVELLNSRITYSHEHLSKVGEIVTPAPIFDISELRDLHLLALQIASGDHGFGE